MTSNAPLAAEGAANAENAEHAGKRNLVPVASRSAGAGSNGAAGAANAEHAEHAEHAGKRNLVPVASRSRVASQNPLAIADPVLPPTAARPASQALLLAAARPASQALPPAAARPASQALPLPLPPAAARPASQALPLRRAAACSGETGTPVPVRSPIRSRSARVATTPKVPGGAGAWLLSARDSRKTSPRKTQRKIQNPRAARRGVPTHHSSPAPHGGQSV